MLFLNDFKALYFEYLINISAQYYIDIVIINEIIKKAVKCYDVTVIQINYPSLNKQTSLEQPRVRFHEEGLV